MKTKSIIKFLLLSILFFGLTAFVPSDSSLVEAVPIGQEFSTACLMDNNAFQVGEELTYTVYWNWGFIWYSAGEVTMRVKDSGTNFHVDVDGKSFKKHDWIFKVRDEYDTYMDKTSLLPTKGIRKVREGGYRLYDEVIFDQNAKKIISNRGKTAASTKRTEYEVESCMHDIISIMYHFRNINFDKHSKGEKFPIKIFMDKEVWPLEVGYRGKEKDVEIKDWDEEFDTVVFGPEVIEGFVFKESDKMKIYATDDKNRVPLMIESPISVGKVKVVLKSYKNLRHEMTAKH